MIQTAQGSELESVNFELFKEYDLGTLISTSPSSVFKKIKKTYGVVPSESGHNIEAIQEIRDLLLSLNLSKDISYGLMICAVHTHWEFSLPIIIDEIDDHYLIGPSRPDYTLNYFPISFVLYKSRAIPYEWTSEKTRINSSELFECFEAINSIAKKINYNHGLFGLSLNFRFKGLFENKIIPTIENPLEKYPSRFKEASIIEKINGEEKKGFESEQVSWNIFSDMRYKLSNSEMEILNLIRSLNP